MTRLREFNESGIDYAQRYLTELSENPEGFDGLPENLLYHNRYSHNFTPSIYVESRRFESRREVAEYLIPKFETHRHLLIDNPGVWSWLGMFYLEENAPWHRGSIQIRRRITPYLVDLRSRTGRVQRNLHYLRGSYELMRVQPSSTYFASQSPFNLGSLTDRVMANSGILSSVGILRLIEVLYTNGSSQKRGFREGRGSLPHLIATLAQLERNFDVYGMDVDALLDILPPDFDRWKP